MTIHSVTSTAFGQPVSTIMTTMCRPMHTP